MRSTYWVEPLVGVGRHQVFSFTLERKAPTTGGRPFWADSHFTATSVSNTYSLPVGLRSDLEHR